MFLFNKFCLYSIGVMFSKASCGCFPSYRFFNRSVIFLASIVEVRPVYIHYPARPRDADIIFIYKFFCYLFSSLGLQSFFSMTSFRIWLSKAMLVYICLSLRFSSSSSFRRLTRDASILRSPVLCRWHRNSFRFQTA